MLKWIIQTSVFYLKQYLECINSGRLVADCDRYQQKAWEAQILYLMLRDFNVVRAAQDVGLWEDFPKWVVPFPIPVDPYAAYLNDALVVSLVPSIPVKGDPPFEPKMWFQKDSKGLSNYKTRLEATIQIHAEFEEAMKKLEVQIERLKTLVK